jgi:hypothetical protein
MFPIALLLAIHVAPEAGTPEYRQPQLAVDSKRVAVTFGSGNVVWFAGAPAGSTQLTKPVKVAEAGKLALGRHRGPRVALVGDAIVITAIVGEATDQAGELMAWRSTDNGRSWSQGVRINDVASAAREGLHAMAATPDGKLVAVWLDLRTQGMKLYSSQSRDGGVTWSANKSVYTSPDGHICECCHPSVVAGRDGRLYVMWRNWLGGSRDMYLAESRDGENWKTQKLGTGTWPLKGCPMDGGGVAVSANGKVATAWRRESNIYLAMPGAQEEDLGKGKDVAVTMSADGSVYAAWTEGTGLRAKVPSKPQPITLTAEGGYVNLAGQGPVYAAWESKGSIFIDRLDH